MGKNDAVDYLAVPAWDKHQDKRVNHDGKVWRPPWIKVRCDNSDDYAYSLLTIRQRGLLLEMWKLAGRLENKIPNDKVWISRAIQSPEDLSDDLETLISRGFLSDYGKITETSLKDSATEIEIEKESPNGDVRRVFDHWQRVRSKERSRLTEGRRRKIKARLGSFSADELIRAIDGVAFDPWEDRPRHDDLTVILRSDEQVEKFIELADNPPLEFRSTAEILGAA